MSEQGGRRLWLTESNPKILGALDVLLLCLQVAAFLNSLDALERYSCVRGNYAVYLLNPFSCLSPVCDCFRVDLCPGSDLRVIWWGSATVLVSAGSQPPSAAFSVPLSSLIMEKVTSGGHTRAHGLFVYKSKEKVLVKYVINPSSWATDVLTVVPFLTLPLHLLLCSFPACCILSLVNLSVL